MGYDKTLLDREQVSRFIESHPGWRLERDELVKTFEFDAFLEGISFVQRVAEAAERADHHPDIDIRYTKVTLRLTTHSVGGLTFRDTQGAEEAERLR